MDTKEMLLDDFEHNDMSKYETNHSYVNSYRISLSNEQAVVGQSSLKLSYDFSGWFSGNGAMFIKFKDNLSTSRMPCKLGVWIYSDGITPWLRATLIDGSNERKVVNLTSGKISWYGWKYLDAEVDPSWALPLKLEQIYAVEIDKAYQGDSSCSGLFYIDQLRFVYIDDEDLRGPTFSEIYPEKDYVYKNSFTFHARITDDMSGVDPQSISVKVNNASVPHHFCEESNRISYSFERVEQGTYHITVDAKDLAGNAAVPYLQKIVTVDLSPDFDKPILSTITPSKTGVEYTTTPRVTFNMIDEKSGIDAEDISVTIDDQKQEVTYDEETGWGYAVSKNELNSGLHHLTITARDRSGNVVGPIKQQFTINEMKPPVNSNDFKISILPDTHSFEYGQTAIRSAVNERTDFIIQLGDLVDQSTEVEYKQVQQNLLLLEDKPMLTIPGNHESFQGNLDSYQTIFGSPTYHFIYGNALFIFLNTAYDQSISSSDSMQFDYLEQLLKRNKKSNIIISTHVPTRDRFGTSHEMNADDANKFETILGTYKKRNQATHITVLFGHLHVIDHWQVEDVSYIIAGNGAAKGYVSNERGNILGHGVLHVTPKGMKYEFIPYVERIYFINSGCLLREICLGIGMTYRLHLQADINKLSSNYRIDLTDYDLIEKQWFSSNEGIATVNRQGIIEAIKPGIATISVVVAEKRAEIVVTVQQTIEF